MASAKVWITIKPQWRGQKVAGMSIDRVLKTRPQTIEGVAIEMTLNIPDEAFMPLRPEVTIDVPMEALHYEPKVLVEFPGVETSP